MAKKRVSPSIKDIEEELKKFLYAEGSGTEGTPPSSKVVSSPSDLRTITDFVKYSDEPVVKVVKDGLDNGKLLELLKNKVKKVKIAEMYGISRSAVTQRVNTLKRKGFLDKGGKVMGIVKDLSLSTSMTEEKCQLQTIQITVPIINPDKIDIMKWDKVIPEVNMKIRKLRKWKVTIGKMGKTRKVVMAWLWSRWIDRPEKVKEICRNYVEYLAKELLKYDIEVDVNGARSGGLQLWRRDGVTPEGSGESKEVIGVYHGVDAEKMFEKDITKERKTWKDSTPDPDGIESNDPSYFVDKDTMEVFVGKLRKGQAMDRLEIPEYMRKATDFMQKIDALTEATVLEIHNKQLHQRVLEKMESSLDKLVGVASSLEENIKYKSDLERMEDAMKRPEDPVDKDISCPICKASFSKRLFLNRDKFCPSCKADLKLYFPSM